MFKIFKLVILFYNIFYPIWKIFWNINNDFFAFCNLWRITTSWNTIFSWNLSLLRLLIVRLFIKIDYLNSRFFVFLRRYVSKLADKFIHLFIFLIYKYFFDKPMAGIDFCSWYFKILKLYLIFFRISNKSSIDRIKVSKLTEAKLDFSYCLIFLWIIFAIYQIIYRGHKKIQSVINILIIKNVSLNY